MAKIIEFPQPHPKSPDANKDKPEAVKTGEFLPFPETAGALAEREELSAKAKELNPQIEDSHLQQVLTKVENETQDPAQRMEILLKYLHGEKSVTETDASSVVESVLDQSWKNQKAA